MVEGMSLIQRGVKTLRGECFLIDSYETNDIYVHNGAASHPHVSTLQR